MQVFSARIAALPEILAATAEFHAKAASGFTKNSLQGNFPL
jgi:hypothetical protein